jgi:hypothetical protein
MSWDDIKKGYGKVATKADGLRTSAMHKMDGSSAPRARSGSDANTDDGVAPTPPPRSLPPPRMGAVASPPRASASAGASHTSNGSGIFTNLSDDDKEALFILLDEVCLYLAVLYICVQIS